MRTAVKDKVSAHLCLPEALYRKLLASAEDNLRSMTSEMEYRLKRSYEQEDKMAQAKEAAA